MSEPPSRTPSWDEIEAFLAIDGWREVRSGGHVFFEKVLPSAEILRSHRSHAGSKTMSQGRFGAILAHQLKVSRAEFWEALRSRRPVRRPSPAVEPPPPSIPVWVAEVLEKELRLSPEEIGRLAPDEARRMAEEAWSKPRARSAEEVDG